MRTAERRSRSRRDTNDSARRRAVAVGALGFSVASCVLVPGRARAEPQGPTGAAPPDDEARAAPTLGAHVSLGAPLHWDALGTRSVTTTAGGRFGAQLVPAFGLYADVGVTYIDGSVTEYTGRGTATNAGPKVIFGLAALASIRPVRFVDLSVGPMVGLGADAGVGAQGRLALLVPLGALRAGPGAEVIVFHEGTETLVTLSGLVSLEYTFGRAQKP